MPWKCLVITPFGRLNCNYVYALLVWGILLVSTSRYSVKVCRMLNLSAMTFKSASRSCLRIHLDCLPAVKNNLFGPQDCLRRCRGGNQGELIFLLGIPLAPPMWLSGGPAVSIVSSYGSILAPRKNDDTDFGCVWIQYNGLIALEIKCCCMRYVNSCSNVLIFESW
jgi:hypothetical protein